MEANAKASPWENGSKDSCPRTRIKRKLAEENLLPSFCAVFLMLIGQNWEAPSKQLFELVNEIQKFGLSKRHKETCFFFFENIGNVSKNCSDKIII